MVRTPKPARGQSWEKIRQQMIVRIIQVSDTSIRVQNEKNDTIYIVRRDSFMKDYRYVGEY